MLDASVGCGTRLAERSQNAFVRSHACIAQCISAHRLPEQGIEDAQVSEREICDIRRHSCAGGEEGDLE